MSTNNNVIGEQGFLNPNDNNNDNINVFDKYERSKRVDMIADQLVAKFNNSDYREFYCKIAWKLSEARIWANYEAAVTASKKKGTHPGRLFSYLCKRDGV